MKKYGLHIHSEHGNEGEKHAARWNTGIVRAEEAAGRTRWGTVARKFLPRARDVLVHAARTGVHDGTQPNEADERKSAIARRRVA